jgi:hypothetical protein
MSGLASFRTAAVVMIPWVVIMFCIRILASHITDSDAEEGSDDSATQATTKCVLLEGSAQAKHD